MARAGISGLTIGAILLLIGGCFGAFVFVTRETSPRAQLVGRAHQPVPTDTRVAGATESMKRQLSPPSVPRLVYKKVEVHAKLPLDQINRLAHTKGCPEQTKLTLRAPVEIAKMQGYTLHEACANRPLEPEYTIVVSVSPEWLA